MRVTPIEVTSNGASYFDEGHLFYTSLLVSPTQINLKAAPHAVIRESNTQTLPFIMYPQKSQPCSAQHASMTSRTSASGAARMTA